MHASLLFSLVQLRELLTLEVVQEALFEAAVEEEEEEVETGRVGLARRVRRVSSDPRWCRVHAPSADPPVSLPVPEVEKPEVLEESSTEV